MPQFTETFTDQHQLFSRTADGKDLVFLSGTAVLTPCFKGVGRDWHKDSLALVIGPGWRHLDEVTPVVSLAKVGNAGIAVEAGWAIEATRWAVFELGSRIVSVHAA